MNLLRRLIAFVVCCGIAPNSHALLQIERINLRDMGYAIENTVEIQISTVNYVQIKKIEGKKIAMNDPTIIINGKDLGVEKIHTRGKTTLHFRRKSYSIHLNKKAAFHYNKPDERLKKFYAISLSMDKNYIRNRLAFGMMKEIGLFDLFYSYAELTINDNSEGIYMILERPSDWAIKKKQSPLLIRRGYNQKIEKLKTSKKIAIPDEKKYKNYYKNIYKSLNKYEGKALYDTLSQFLDMELYMKWLAFNYLIKNGDYTDEVYFYIDPTIGKFKIIPWDYDDLFAHTPHEGKEIKKRQADKKLIFSSEDKLDRKIAHDPYLYSIYISIFRETLNALSDKVLINVFEKTYAELLPYLTKEETLSMAKYDLYKDVNINALSIEMQNIYVMLVQTRDSYLGYLQK